MIPLVGLNEAVAQFPQESVEMRPACSPAIRRHLKSLFGARSVRYLGSGFHNAHHLLSGIPGCPDLVVRRMLAPLDVLSQRLAREYRVLEYLASEGYPHAPQPVRRLVPGELDGCPAFAMTFVDGVMPTEFDPDTCYQLGKAVGVLHRLPVPEWLSRAGSTTDPLAILLNPWSISRLNFTLLGRSMPEVHCHRLASVVDALPDRLRSLDWGDATNVIVHADLGIHNCIRSIEGMVLIDWEFAAVSDPTLDLMWLFARDGFGEREQGHFLEGYIESYGRQIPGSWRQRFPILRSMALAEIAIWAQSGVNDIKEGHNTDFFGPGDLERLECMVARIHEAVIY